MLDGVKQTLLVIKMRKYEAHLRQISDDPDFPLPVDGTKEITSKQCAMLDEYKRIQEEYLAVVKESKELRAK